MLPRLGLVKGVQGAEYLRPCFCFSWSRFKVHPPGKPPPCCVSLKPAWTIPLPTKGIRPDCIAILGATPSRSISMARPDGSRSEEHTSELQSPCISYAVFCLKKKKT